MAATAASVREASPVVLMVGALWYGPNREALERFLAECWPVIRAVVPEARFRAVGAASADVRAVWSSQPGVECPGFVDDLAAEYRNARVTVVPVRSGGGTQIKAIESLAHGRVPVVSPFVANGFEPHLRHGESLLVAGQSADIAETVIAVLRDPGKTIALAEKGQQITCAVFSPEAFREHVKVTLDSIGKRLSC